MTPIGELVLSDETIEHIIEQVSQNVMNQFEERLNLVSRILDLPVTPNKSEIRKILRIGDSQLKFLMANGAAPMVWGGNTVRIERADLLKAFDNTKIRI